MKGLLFPSPAAPVRRTVPTTVYLQWTVVLNFPSFPITGADRQTAPSPGTRRLATPSATISGFSIKTGGVEPMVSDKGLVVLRKQRSGHRKLATSYVRPPLTRMPGPPPAHQAHDPRERVQPTSPRDGRSHSPSHPAQPEACDGGRACGPTPPRAPEHLPATSKATKISTTHTGQFPKTF